MFDLCQFLKLSFDAKKENEEWGTKKAAREPLFRRVVTVIDDSVTYI